MQKYSLFVLIVVYILGINACSAPQNPTFVKVENMKVKVRSLKKITIEADAVFNNPNMLGATITESEFEVFVDGKKLADAKQSYKITAKGQSDFSLPIELEAPVKDVFGNLGKMLGGVLGSKKMKIRIEGKLYLELAGNKLKIPFTHEELYEGAF